MTILAVCGSARKGGNTETLVRESLKGAGADGAEINILSEMDISGCIGCAACRAEGAEGCVVEDDMQALYEKLRDADALILGSPVFYGEVTGQMKCFMDRWYALRAGDRSLRIRSGVKALFILVQGADGPERYSCAVNRLNKVMSSYGMDAQVLVAPGLEGKGAAAEHPELLKAAFDAGKRLIS